MKIFFDRVSELNLPPATEYLLLVLLFKPFIMHLPESIFNSWVRRFKKEEADTKQEPQTPPTAQCSSNKSNNSKAKNTTDYRDKDALATEIFVNGTTIQCSDFSKSALDPSSATLS